MGRNREILSANSLNLRLSPNFVFISGTGVITLWMDGVLIAQWARYDRWPRRSVQLANTTERDEEEVSWSGVRVHEPTERSSLLPEQQPLRS